LSCAVADDPLAGFASAAGAYPAIDRVIATNSAAISGRRCQRDINMTNLPLRRPPRPVTPLPRTAHTSGPVARMGGLSLAHASSLVCVRTVRARQVGSASPDAYATSGRPDASPAALKHRKTQVRPP
jgi:hypothetical protein